MMFVLSRASDTGDRHTKVIEFKTLEELMTWVHQQKHYVLITQRHGSGAPFRQYEVPGLVIADDYLD